MLIPLDIVVIFPPKTRDDLNKFINTQKNEYYCQMQRKKPLNLKRIKNSQIFLV